MDPVAVLTVTTVASGILNILAGTIILSDRRPDNPRYRPKHVRREPDGIERALTASHHELRRRSLHPWAPSPADRRNPRHPYHPPSDENVTLSEEEPMLTRVVAYLPRATKALVAAAGAWAAAYAGAVDGGVTADEWIVIVAAGVAAGAAVWLAPNKTPET